MEPETFRLPSASGDADLNCCRWIPDGYVRATLQISHGMIEHIMRYSDFASFLCSYGIAVYGHDHLGHGNTSLDDPGYFGDEDGDELLISDLHTVCETVTRAHPAVPHFMLGHSMGSFVARRFITRYGGELNGVIIMGTGNQPRVQVAFAKAVAGMLCWLRGPRYVSGFLNRAVLSSNDKRFDAPDLPNRWLSRDGGKVAEYDSDPMCQFRFTVSGFRDVFKMVSDLESRVDFDRIPTDLPVVFMSGSEDPIGGFGKGVMSARDDLASAGLEPTLILYEGARHEILNETNRDEVYEDILEWIDSLIR